MNPTCIQTYITFISKHSYKTDLLPFVVESLSQFVTKRKSVVDTVLSEASISGARVSYTCLLKMIRDHVVHVLESSSSEEKVFKTKITFN